MTASTKMSTRRTVFVKLLRVAAWATASGIPSIGIAADVHQRVVLPKGRSLDLRLPADWLMAVRKGPDLEARTIVLSPAHGRPFEVSLSLDDGRPDPEDLRATVATMLDRVQGRAVEQPLRMTALKGAQGAGWYFSATDGAAAANEYTHVTQGAIPLDGYALQFIILTRDGQERVVADALASIARLQVRR